MKRGNSQGSSSGASWQMLRLLLRLPYSETYFQDIDGALSRAFEDLWSSAGHGYQAGLHRAVVDFGFGPVSGSDRALQLTWLAGKLRVAPTPEAGAGNRMGLLCLGRRPTNPPLLRRLGGAGAGSTSRNAADAGPLHGFARAGLLRSTPRAAVGPCQRLSCHRAWPGPTQMLVMMTSC